MVLKTMKGYKKKGLEGGGGGRGGGISSPFYSKVSKTYRMVNRLLTLCSITLFWGRRITFSLSDQNKICLTRKANCYTFFW